MNELKLLAKELIEKSDERGKTLEALLLEQDKVSMETPYGKLRAIKGEDPDYSEIYVELELENGEIVELLCIESDKTLDVRGQIFLGRFSSAEEGYVHKEVFDIRDELNRMLLNALYNVTLEKVNGFDVAIEKANELRTKFLKKENAYELIRTHNLTELAEEIFNEG